MDCPNAAAGVNGNHEGCVNGATGGVFGLGYNPFGLGIPFNFPPEVITASLRGLMTNTVPIIQGFVGNMDQQAIAQAIHRMSMGKINCGQQANHSNKQFTETVKVDKAGSGSGGIETYRVDIILGGDAKPESLKISRNKNLLSIHVSTEKLTHTQDGSLASRLYQEYTRKITLPENSDLTKLESVLSPEGVLRVSVPLVPIQIPVPEEVILNVRQPVPIPVIVDEDMTD